MTNTDAQIIATLTEALQAAQQTLESMLTAKRPDLLPRLHQCTTTKELAYERISHHNGLGLYLCATIEKLELARAKASALEAGRTPWPEQLFEKTLQRWDIADLSAVEQAEQPSFKVVVQHDGVQIRVKVCPELAPSGGVEPYTLDVGFEINHNTPCMHIHGGKDDLELSVFASEQGGVLLRSGDGKSVKNMIVSDSFMPGEDGTSAVENFARMTN